MIPELSETFDCYGYDPEALTLGFRFEGLPVILERRTVPIYDTENEEKARRLVTWISGTIHNKKIRGKSNGGRATI
jgi:hypothetical protein